MLAPGSKGLKALNKFYCRYNLRFYTSQKACYSELEVSGFVMVEQTVLTKADWQAREGVSGTSVNCMISYEWQISLKASLVLCGPTLRFIVWL